MIIIKEKMQIKIFKLKQGGELLVKCNNMYWICKYIHTHVQRHRRQGLSALYNWTKKCCLLLPQCPITFCFLKHYPFVNTYKQTLKPLIKYLNFFKCIPRLISWEGNMFIYISNLNNIELLSIYANFGVFI